MKLFIILLINYINLFVFSDRLGGRISKDQLRCMQKEELKRLIMNSFVNTFDNIYDKIIESAKEGKNAYDFTIMCRELIDSNCKVQNGHQVWLELFPNNIITKSYITHELIDSNCKVQNDGVWQLLFPNIITTYITIENYTTMMIAALHRSFPDSNITKIYKNCCDYHIIKW